MQKKQKPVINITFDIYLPTNRQYNLLNVITNFNILHPSGITLTKQAQQLPLPQLAVNQPQKTLYI